MSHIVDTIIAEGLTDTKSFRTQAIVQATAASTLTLAVDTERTIILTGTTAGQLVKLGVATTYQVGHIYEIHNNSTATVTVQNNTPTTLFTLAANQRGSIILQNNSTAAGIWVYAINASTIIVSTNILATKSGTVSAGTFAGNPKTATVTFGTAFANTSYSITLTGLDDRSLSWQSKAAGSFVINTNSNVALTGNVDWQCIVIGEST